MLGEITVQQFLEILSGVIGEITASCMVACILGTMLFWFFLEILKLLYSKLFFKKGRENNEEKL